MSYSLIFTEKPEYLLCITDGKVSDTDSFIEWAMIAMARAEELGYARVLFDNRTFKLDLTPFEVISFAKHLEDMGAAKLGFRMAVVSCPENLETSHIVETALVNRSGTYKSFRNQKEAKEWLLK